MKKSAWAAAALIAALVFSGCVLGVRDGGGGSITLSFAAAPGVKTPGAKAVGDEVAKVWVYSGGALLQGGPYTGLLEAGYGVVTIDNVPAGSNYRVVVYIRYEYESEVPGDTFVDHYYAVSHEPFAVSAGAETVVQLFPSYIDVVEGLDAAGEVPLLGVRSVAITNPEGPFYSAATADTVFTAWSFDEYSNIFNADYTSGGETINSVTVGYQDPYEVVFINSSTGISQSGDGVGDWGELPAPNVWKSAVLDSFYLYRAAGEFGGYEMSEGSDPWVRIPRQNPASRVFDITAVPYSDPFANPNRAALIATNFVGTFIVDSYFFSPDESFDRIAALHDPAERLARGVRLFSEDPNWGPGRPQVQCFGFDSAGSLLLGTANGLYITNISWEGKDSPTPVIDEPYFFPGTDGLSITKICGGDYNRAAFIASSGVMLTTFNGEVLPLPFLGDLVGTVNDIAFDYIWDSGPYASLVVAGSGGLVRFSSPDLFWVPMIPD